MSATIVLGDICAGAAPVHLEFGIKGRAWPQRRDGDQGGRGWPALPARGLAQLCAGDVDSLLTAVTPARNVVSAGSFSSSHRRHSSSAVLRCCPRPPKRTLGPSFVLYPFSVIQLCCFPRSLLRRHIQGSGHGLKMKSRFLSLPFGGFVVTGHVCPLSFFSCSRSCTLRCGQTQLLVFFRHTRCRRSLRRHLQKLPILVPSGLVQTPPPCRPFWVSPAHTHFSQPGVHIAFYLCLSVTVFPSAIVIFYS